MDLWANYEVDANGCWNWTRCKNKHGYGMISVYEGNSKKTWYAHRYAYFLHHGVNPGKGTVCHCCDNPACINPGHLWLGDMRQNNDDMLAKGRYTKQKGADNNRAILTDDLVAQIRASELDAATTAQEFGISRNHVYAIRNRRKWTHV